MSVGGPSERNVDSRARIRELKRMVVNSWIRANEEKSYRKAEWEHRIFLNSSIFDTGVSKALEALATEVKQSLAFFMLLFFCQPILRLCDLKLSVSL